MLNQPSSTLLHASRGRLRFRVSALRGSADLADRLETALGSVPGIREATASTRTGSLLILYDPEVLALAENGIQLIRSLVDILPGSFTATSVSFKLAAAKHPEFIVRLQRCLGHEQGVEGIAADSSGQITVNFDPARLNIEQVIQTLIGMAHNQKRAPWRTPAARQAPLTHPSAGGP